MKKQRVVLLQMPWPSPGFDAEAYWSTREHKKWLVLLRKPGKHFATKMDKTGRIKLFQQLLYVQARSKERAIETARAHSMIRGQVNCYGCRLATPVDLGCVSAGNEPRLS